jgi:hypothetical protein
MSSAFLPSAPEDAAMTATAKTPADIALDLFLAAGIIFAGPVTLLAYVVLIGT